jgi:hypothetical protein
MEYNKDNLVMDIMDFECGEITEERLLAMFQYLVDTGMAWQLQGFYGRTAEALIEAGHITKATPETSGN